jgi:hypothetical protein
MFNVTVYFIFRSLSVFVNGTAINYIKQSFYFELLRNHGPFFWKYPLLKCILYISRLDWKQAISTLVKKNFYKNIYKKNPVHVNFEVLIFWHRSDFCCCDWLCCWPLLGIWSAYRLTLNFTAWEFILQSSV